MKKEILEAIRLQLSYNDIDKNKYKKIFRFKTKFSSDSVDISAEEA